ncbi:MAG TPA: cytochrome b/b6 domain-containing protein [Acidimicrobiales bacterium]|nr:cytochrome b/b6 domain-containing protein [Acidimicrobiales bacterium]
MLPSTEGVRFDRVERWFHWANAVLFLVLLASAAALYLDPLSRLVGRRALVRDIHVYSGLALPVVWVLAFGPLRTVALRADVRRLNRWTADDWHWVRSFGRDPYAKVGKFNPGQKLNAAIIAGAVPVLLGTGVIMRWFTPFPLTWRTGATFVHDWLAVVVFAFTVGHIGKALSHPSALRAMWSGSAKPVSPPARSR